MKRLSLLFLWLPLWAGADVAVIRRFGDQTATFVTRSAHAARMQSAAWDPSPVAAALTSLRRLARTAADEVTRRAAAESVESVMIALEGVAFGRGRAQQLAALRLLRDLSLGGFGAMPWFRLDSTAALERAAHAYFAELVPPGADRSDNPARRIFDYLADAAFRSSPGDASVDLGAVIDAAGLLMTAALRQRVRGVRDREVEAQLKFVPASTVVVDLAARGGTSVIRDRALRSLRLYLAFAEALGVSPHPPELTCIRLFTDAAAPVDVRM